MGPIGGAYNGLFNVMLLSVPNNKSAYRRRNMGELRDRMCGSMRTAKRSTLSP